MPAPILVLAGVGLLAGTALGILAVIIIGIHRGDRGHLGQHAPKSHSDALARRILVGVRYPSETDEGGRPMSRITDLIATEYIARHCTDPQCAEVHRTCPLVPPQGMAFQQNPRPQEHRKEVMPS